MCRVPVQLRESVKQRLAAAAEEIFELLERTIAEYEEESERQRTLLEQLLQPRVRLLRTEPIHIKEEPLWNDVTIKIEETAPPSEPEEEKDVSETWTCPQTQDWTLDQDQTQNWTHNQTQDQTKDCPPHSRTHSRTQACPPHSRTQACPSPAAPLRHHYRRPILLRAFCSLCNKGFTRKSSLDRHMTVHTGEKPFSCSVCGQKFSLKFNLQSHVRRRGHEAEASAPASGLCVTADNRYQPIPSHFL